MNQINQESETTNIIPTLAWTAHPVKRKPLVSILVTAFILVISYLVLASTDSQVFSGLSLVIMFGSLAKFYLPTRYELTNNEIVVKNISYTLRKSWDQYRSFYPDKNGILLSPFKERSRLENFRGLYLMFEKNNQQVTQFVSDHINTSAPVIEPTSMKTDSKEVTE